MIPHSRPTLGLEEKEAVEEVLESGQIAQGKKVAQFEETLSRFVGRRFGVATSSGTAALHLSLLALEVSRGDEVILPSYTCAALLHAVEAVGARPVLVDIELDDFNISLADVKKKIRRRTKALIVPHALGRATRMEELLDLGISVIEDGTQALGARAGERKVGSFGVVSVFSFYATKMISTGEGGMILTDSFELAERLRDIRDYDKKESYRFRTNSKMTDLEAALGLTQIKKLPHFIERRREIASRYQKAFGGFEVLLPQEDPSRDHVYYRYVVRLKHPKEWMRRFQERGIEVKEPVFKPLHRYLNFPDALFPQTEQAVRECVSLPIYPSLSDEECEQICRAIRGEGTASQKKKAQVLVA